MDSELGQAFYTVYTSSKQILKNNNQRHLFCNTLDLLTSSCKTAGMNCYLISNNDLVKFWLNDVLPLMFDSDRGIQNSAVAAMDQAIVGLQIADVHSSSHWPELKGALITKYAPQINALRESKNSQWHKIWCILICILDREILRGASVINSFLSIVELGFRNMDNSVRAEAFLCWRLLIKIFSAYDELGSPKRLKLICIPLKSSQSKSAHAATVKFRTWWYLLNCLSTRLVENFDNVVEPFLIFAFGASKRSNTQAVAQQYRSAFTLALPSLVTLLSPTHTEQLQRIMREQQLEPFIEASPLIKREVLKQHWRPLLTAVMEAIKLHYKHDAMGDTTETEQQLLHMLMRNLTQIMINQHVAPFTVQMCAELEKLLPDQARTVLTVFNTIATEQLSLLRDDNDVEEYKAVLGAFMQLCIKAKAEVPPSILQRGICLIYATESLQGDFRLLSSLLDLVLLTTDEESYDTFEVKLVIWRQLSHAIIDYLRINSLDYRLKQNAQLLDRWLLWPLQTYASFAGRRNSAIFDSAFCELWRQLLNAGHNSLERKKFLADIRSALSELLRCRKEDAYFAELFDAYLAAVLKLGVTKDSPLQKDAFALLQELLNQQNLAQKICEGCLNSLRNAFIGLKNNEVTLIYDELKPLLSLILQTWKKHNYEGAFLDEWKRALQDKFRTHPIKIMANQLKELFKGNDVFVIIPSVWSLNPEKLTDRQKERFAEKADIPALYNDMSQSQDSSLKAWTPKKIVIAKNNQAEIAIEGNERIEPFDNDLDVLNKSANLDIAQRRTRNTITKSTPNATEYVSPTKSSKDDAYIIEKRRTRATIDDGPHKIPSRSISIDEAPLLARLTRQRNMKKDAGEKTEPEKRAALTVHRSPSKQPRSISPIKTQGRKSTFRDLFADLAPNSVQSCAESAEVTPSLPLDAGSKAHTDLDTELSSQYVENAVIVVEPTVLNTAKDNIHNAAVELAVLQETSPKKTTTRFTGLSSPPDRKLTNNSTSPTLRPKPTAHLTGRGAQLINMIRNKKIDTQSAYSPLAAALSRTTQLSIPATPRNVERVETSTPTVELYDLTGTDQTSTPMQLPKDLLTFSKRLPSPSASPSASILKRKMRYDSLDDSVESPAFKRKRVSFHDPPVSITKEYLRDVDENRSKLKRCLVLDKTGQVATTPEMKHVLRRRSRIDSIQEIEKYGTADQQIMATKAILEGFISPVASKPTEGNIICTDDRVNTNAEDDSICSLKWHDNSRNVTANETSDGIHKSASKATQMDGVVATTSGTADCRDLAITDTESALNIVLEQCPLESVLEKYFNVMPNTSTGPLKNANVLAKFMSHQMNSNPKIKSTILETLSENHSKDFLDHAVQENLSSVVCDRLNLNSVLDYICSKSKINTSCRNNLLAQVPDIIRSSKVETERLNFIENLLQKSNFSDDNILDIMAMLMRARERREFNTESVSESAVDSSSNL